MFDINNLMELEIDEFVRNIYRTFLGREADEAGLTFFLNEYKNGLSKEKILFIIRTSDEGIGKNYPLEGLNIKEIHLNELIWREPKAFIEASYIAVLGRNADCDGLNSYYQEYAAGHLSKEEIIQLLRYSAEGKKWSVKIHGLKVALLKRRVKNVILKLPLIGRFARCIKKINHIEKVFDSRFGETGNSHAEQAETIVSMPVAVDSDDVVRLQNEIENLKTELAIERIQRRKREETFIGVEYKEYEDKMRGTRKEIKERLNVYEAIINKVKANNGQKLLAVDLGCGRGEWLELLRDSYNIKAIGVDSDVSMLEDCKKNNLDVLQGDLMTYLKNMASESVDMITMFQVVEHLPIGTLNEALCEVYRVLRKGGAVILETPNPENLIIGACNFYFDPTHYRQIPPILLKIFVEAVGMSDAEIVRIHPYSAIQVEELKDTTPSEIAVKQIAGFINNYADYAVTAFKI